MSNSTSVTTSSPVIVFGESSASIFLIHELIKKNEKVLWATGTGTRLVPVMPYVKSEKALATLISAQNTLDSEPYSRPLESGVFHRVFRSKAFKMPSWKRATSLETQAEAMADFIWAPERAFLGVTEYRVAGLTPVQIEEGLRTHFETHPLIKKIANSQVVEFEVFDQGGKIQFQDGFITEFKQFYFCDSLSQLRSIPKLGPIFKNPLSGIKMSNQMNALQVVFHHKASLGQSHDIGFVIPMNRDSGETFDRDVMGYFLDEEKSVWTVFLETAECEDNHGIMKKLRKMKQSLSRAFESPEFLSTVEREQVRFEENCIIVDGALKASQSNPDFVMLPDSLGLTWALEAIADRFELETLSFESPVATQASEEQVPLPQTSSPELKNEEFSPEL